MQTSRLKIGLYCPFIFPVVKDRKDMDFIEISWNQCSSLRIGNTELCRKMTAVYKQLKSGVLDVLVMVNCCNLSDRLKDIFEGEFEGRILMAVFPRRVNEKMPDVIAKELERISNRISSITPVVRKENSMCFVDNVSGIEENQETQDASNWCRLPESFRIEKSMVDNHEMVQRLIENIACPRLIYEDDNEGVIQRRMKDFVVEDPCCILQCYGETMKKWLDKRKDSI